MVDFLGKQWDWAEVGMGGKWANIEQTLGRVGFYSTFGQ